MNKYNSIKSLVGLLTAIVLVGAGCSAPAYNTSNSNTAEDNLNKAENIVLKNEAGMEKSNKAENIEPVESTSEVKEFNLTSFTKIVDGKYYPQFSEKELTVKKGDKVRIKITVTSGMHDFKIDEFNVYADTQPNKEAVVEFVADKAGEFVYYCTKPNHRALGHWGTLKVVE